MSSPPGSACTPDDGVGTWGNSVLWRGGGSSSTLHEQQILPDSRILVVDARSPPMNISLGEEEAKILHSLTGTFHNSSDSGLRTHLIHATIPSQTTRSGNMETLNTKAIP